MRNVSTVDKACIKGKPVVKRGRKAWSPEKDSSAATIYFEQFFYCPQTHQRLIAEKRYLLFYIICQWVFVN